jgi:hypothetical protein
MLEEVVSTKMEEMPTHYNWQKLEKVAQMIREIKCWEARASNFYQNSLPFELRIFFIQIIFFHLPFSFFLLSSFPPLSLLPPFLPSPFPLTPGSSLIF